jgi:hypothetical protein
MKTVQIDAVFDNMTPMEFKQLFLDDPAFQQHVQESQGHHNVKVGAWHQKNSSTLERLITFEAPMNGPSSISKYLGGDTCPGESIATMKVSGSNVEGVTDMKMLGGMLKDSLSIKIEWKITPLGNNKTSVVYKIMCEFKKWIPIVQGLIESTCASNAQKTYENLIQMAKQKCSSSS